MNSLRLAVAVVVVFGAMGALQAGDVVEEGVSAFKAVCDRIYEEMGSPAMTEEVAEKMDRAIFNRDLHAQPALSRKVTTSWGTYKNAVIATVAAEVDGQTRQVRVIWRPGRALERIDPDAVLEW